MNVSKNAYGDWSARSSFDLGGGRVLEVLTMKRFNKSLATTATVSIVDPGTKFMSHRVYTDYSKELSRITGRCTEKVVRAEHEAALRDLERIKQDVKAHYKHLGESA